MQDVQVTRHNSDKGEPTLLHDVRVVWVKTFCQRYQDWLPSPDRQAKEEGCIGPYYFDVMRYVAHGVSFELFSLSLELNPDP